VVLLLLGLFRVPPAAAQFPPAPGTGPGLAETIEAIDSARITTRILYITAHPDDESAAVLTYLARGLHADVALLSLTRGEGGQNALGPEQAPQLGLIRTQELLAATRGYGVKLFFTRARDFGYSKTPEETERIWGDQVLEDMVRVIRTFRPNIVINGWGGVHTGHGHHQVSGLWTPKAVALAADPLAYPELSKENLAPWNGGLEPMQILDLDRISDHPSGYVLPLDDVSPLYGKSWREIGLDAFVNHRTQGIAGFLNSPFLRRPIALNREDGKPLDPSSLARPLTGFLSAEVCESLAKFCSAVSDADANLKSAHEEVERQHWQEAASHLESASLDIHRLIPPCDILNYPWPLNQAIVWEAGTERYRIMRALEMVYGFRIEATAERGTLAAGDSVQVSVKYRCRSGLKCPVYESAYSFGHGTFHWIEGHSSKDTTFDMPIPFESPLKNSTALPVQLFEDSAASIFARTNKESVCMEGIREPIVHVEATSTNVVKVPLRIVPSYTLAVEPSQTIEVLNSEHKPFDLFLRVHSYSTKVAKIAVGLNVPDGIITSAPVELAFDGIGDQYAKFTVTPPAKLDPGNFTITAYAKRGDETFSTSLEPLPSMPTILWSEPAQCIVHAFDINVPPHLRIGYVSAEGEPIPDALKRLGINVEMLDATALNFGDLSKYDAIVVGVRAYELRPELAGANKRLLDYVSAGGTLVVQYNRDFVWDKLQPAPYPAKIGSPTPRITDENAAVRFLQPADALLNFPNRITAADFNNWVQERGLYYWSDFDSHYTPLLAMHDLGENDLKGGLVYTRYGLGTYIYTGLSFFRQLPEGNSGAYRLFVNLISASRARQPSGAQ
jgi:LmbE family N-acetylglucosaminyl deacetylase